MTLKGMNRACVAVTIIHLGMLYMLHPYLFVTTLLMALTLGLTLNPNEPYFIIFAVTVTTTTLITFILIMFGDDVKSALKSRRITF